MNQELVTCFNNQLQDFVYHNFQLPAVVKQNNFKGKIITLFEVDSTGTFKVLYAATYAKYTFTIAIPLQSTTQIAQEKLFQENKILNSSLISNIENPEFESVTLNYAAFKNPQFKSHLNIPFSHNLYTNFDGEMNH
ncbi:hypothetical protein SU65_07695 [Flavobacterium psychrophilum]|nr:hypothetical protein SU65_07695 [Flavobacterium psychrophilum]